VRWPVGIVFSALLLALSGRTRAQESQTLPSAGAAQQTHPPAPAAASDQQAAPTDSAHATQPTAPTPEARPPDAASIRAPSPCPGRALSRLPNIYIFTHDSIGVGEDGPTHEPVETVSSVRIMPQIDVIRPADPEETAGAFVAAAQRTDGPTLIALTRQVVPILNGVDLALRREGVARGGYVAKKEKGKLDLIIMSCGSELQHALEAAKELGDGVRVVSMPCMERFERESEKYREEVLPKSCRKRVAIEAGILEIWYQYVGLDGKVVGLHEFGLSAPGAEVMKERGIDAKHVVDAAKSL